MNDSTTHSTSTNSRHLLFRLMAISMAVLLSHMIYEDLEEGIDLVEWDEPFAAVAVGISALYWASLAVSPNSRIMQFQGEVRQPIHLQRAMLGLCVGIAVFIAALLLPEHLKGILFSALFMVFSALAVSDWLRRRANRDDTKSAIP